MKKKSKKSGNKYILKTQPELARIMKITARTVRSWKSDGMPVEKDGCYNLEKIITWRIQKEQKKSKVGSPELRKHEIEYRKFRALQVRLDYEIKAEKYLPVDEVEAAWRNTLTILKNNLLNLPRQISPQLENLEVLEIEAILTDRIREMIQRLGNEAQAELEADEKNEQEINNKKKDRKPN